MISSFPQTPEIKDNESEFVGNIHKQNNIIIITFIIEYSLSITNEYFMYTTAAYESYGYHISDPKGANDIE